MEKLNQMTVELQELKTARETSYFSVSDTFQPTSLEDAQISSSDELVIASELLELELKQLRETKFTFNKIIRSLKAKSAGLELLQQWCEPEVDGEVVAERSSTPAESGSGLADPLPEADATGGAVNVKLPKVVPGHYAASEAGVVEMSSPSLHRSASDDALQSTTEWGTMWYI
jgi:hypothetical protein